MQSFNQIYQNIKEERLDEAKKPLSEDQIESFRKEFLKLMKNSKRIDDYDDAMEWKRVMIRWRDQFEEFIFSNVLDQWEKMKKNGTVHEGTWYYWDDRIRKDLWPLTVGLQVPIEQAGKVGSTDFKVSKESRFSDFKKQWKTWENRIRRLARQAWKTLKEFREEWIEATGEKEPQIEGTEKYEENIQGIPVIFKYVEGKRHLLAKDVYDKTKKAIQIFVKRSKERVPVILKDKDAVPIFVDISPAAKKDPNAASAGAQYEPDRTRIKVFEWGLLEKHQKISQIIAHEYTHHIYRNYLSKEAKKKWDNFTNGHTTTIDLREILERYKNERKLVENEKIRKDDPVLYRQLEEIIYPDSGYGDDLRVSLYTIKRLKDYLEKGNDPYVEVKTNPISGYGDTKGEEAFSEAVSLYAIYGSEAVLPIVEAMIKNLLGMD